VAQVNARKPAEELWTMPATIQEVAQKLEAIG
jgi:hypothetical protein